MKKLKLTKLITGILVVVSILSLNPIGASAVWKQNSTGWTYDKGENHYAKGWEIIDGKVYCFDQNSYMKTGWIQEGRNWFYLYSNGQLSYDTAIDGYYLNTVTGEWSKTPIENTSININSQVVIFEDEKLENEVRKTINKLTGTLYKSDVEKITELKAGSKDIKYINGIENLVNLQTLDLSFNQINDISALKNLTNLKKLNILDNQISDIGALKRLTNLQELSLGQNQISDISLLEGLTNLESFESNCNSIKDISALKGLTNLKKIDLSSTQIDDNDISNLENLKSLSFLRLAYNQISKIDVLKGLTKLEYLNLDGTKVSDADRQALKKTLTNCLILDSAINNTNNVSNIGSQNSNAQIITFADKNLEKAVRDNINKPTGDLYKSDVEKITKLRAEYKNIKDISGIEYLTNLECLYLTTNSITDITPLKNLTNLEKLNIEFNEISDISVLQKLTKLNYLRLDANRIKDISGLKNLTKLQELGLCRNQISDISSLKGLTNLKELALSSNKISDADKQALEYKLNLKIRF